MLSKPPPLKLQEIRKLGMWDTPLSPFTLYHTDFQAQTDRNSREACRSGSPEALDMFLHIPYYLGHRWYRSWSHRQQQQQALDVHVVRHLLFLSDWWLDLGLRFARCL